MRVVLRNGATTGGAGGHGTSLAASGGLLYEPVPVVPRDRSGGGDVQGEHAQEQAAQMWAADTASRALGMELGEVTAGSASVRMVVRADMVNGHGTCHGGYLFLLADSAFAFAANTYGVPAVAAGADVAFLAPAREGDELVATAQERALRGRSGLYDVTVRRGDEVVLEFRGRSRSLPPRPS